MTESTDEKLLESLLLTQKNEKREFFIQIEERSYPLNEALITKSPTPVHRPTQRGGVYFSDTYVYKIKGTIYDSTLIPLLSKTMLGPSTEFSEILVKTSTVINSNKVNISLYANLTNIMQSKSKIELNLVITRVEKQ